MAREKFPCMVLCNGTSKRFGGNKMLAPLAGKPLFMHTVDRLRDQISEMAINGDPAIYDPVIYKEMFECPVLLDRSFAQMGPLAGIFTALSWAESLGASRVLTVSGDTPFIPLNWAKELESMPAGKITLPRVEGRSHLVCGLWPTNLRPDLYWFLQAGESRSVQAFLHTQKPQFVEFSKENGMDPFFNVNTQEDMKRAEKILHNLAS